MPVASCWEVSMPPYLGDTALQKEGVIAYVLHELPECRIKSFIMCDVIDSRSLASITWTPLLIRVPPGSIAPNRYHPNRSSRTGLVVADSPMLPHCL